MQERTDTLPDLLQLLPKRLCDMACALLGQATRGGSRGSLSAPGQRQDADMRSPLRPGDPGGGAGGLISASLHESDFMARISMFAAYALLPILVGFGNS